MFGHIPFRNIFLAAVVANKRTKTLVLPHVHIKVGTGVVLLIAAFICTLELINILMSFFMVSKNPMLPKLGEASWI